jgi:hypothetical protein
MTTAHVEKFAELVGKDPDLLAKLGLDKVNADAAAAVASAEAFITNAVKEAKALGLEFSEEEAHAFLDAEAKAQASGELSDTQLEAVAGGKNALGKKNGKMQYGDRDPSLMKGNKNNKGGALGFLMGRR